METPKLPEPEKPKDQLQEFIAETRERFRRIPIDYEERATKEMIENLRE